ncbi:MAG: double-strand break repair protein AddB [Rhodospirillaceae bacterium]
MTNANVFTIAPGRPFVDVLARSLLTRYADDPAGLIDVRVLLPTRRAVRALSEAFLRHSGGRTVLLPHMTPLGDLADDELELVLDTEGFNETALDLPPAIAGMRRQILLAQLICKIPGRAETAEQALALARELARLLDQVATERLTFGNLAALVPDDFAEHWKVTLTFLKILTEHWPAILAGEGAVDGAVRRNILLERRAAAWQAKPPETPVIAAGSTGSIPATADLLHVVAHLPQGAVILPGLDRGLSDDAWRALEPQHPQFGLARLLDTFDMTRDQVRDWDGGDERADDGALAARFRALSTALRPAAATGSALDADIGDMHTAFQNVRRIDCPTPAEEALAIALCLREALETPGKRAALVTPDRALARRVRAELRRWDIHVDDSAGVPLAETAPGGFLRLAAEAVRDRFQPVSLLSLLKHPLAGLGLPTARLRHLARRMEVAMLRGPRPAGGTGGLTAALARARHMDADERDATDDLIKRLETASREFSTLMATPAAPVRDLARAHIRMAEAMAATDHEPGAARLWAGDAGEAAAVFMNEVQEHADGLGAINGRDYPALIDELAAGRGLRPRHGGHPRLAVWGLLEARLQNADLMILGGLNEGVWPPALRPSPWMSRPMMMKFGLPDPDRRVGLTAHDFVQAMMAPAIIITRAGRADGAPTVPARWLLRIENLLTPPAAPGEARRALPARDGGPLAWAAALDKPDALIPPVKPMPKPDVALRPPGLSVTQIETWVRDPYAVYARHILKLEPLDPLDADPGAAEKGTLIHEALNQFIDAYPRDLPPDAEARLIDIGGRVFAEAAPGPGVMAFWWPRFLRVARWFVDNERARRVQGYRPLAWERRGERTIDAASGFRVSAKADRIDRGPGGGLVIVDYKTGQAPSWKQVEVGFSPQLPLEAAIAETGGFDTLPAGAAETFNYLRLTGGREAGEDKRQDAGEMAADAWAGLARRVKLFAKKDTPYPPHVKPMYDTYDGPYDQLARVRAWMAVGGEDA